MSEELAAILKNVEPVEEKRQCVTKTVAAGILWRRHGRRPTMEEVAEEAATLRLEQARQALEATEQMGEPMEFVTPVEHELRCQAHDVLHAHHERDFRTLAVFPVQALEDAKVVILRADVRGRLLVEEIVGPNWQPQGWTIFALIWKGQMVLAQPRNPLMCTPGWKVRMFRLHQSLVLVSIGTAVMTNPFQHQASCLAACADRPGRLVTV